MLQERVAELCVELAVPGVAVGVLHEGHERYACHGVTSVENPLPVDSSTLFQFGSTGKTFVAVAILRLVESGVVDLHALVRTYVPELRLRDESVAERVTILQLLNHTAGWDGDFFEDTGGGDDALARFVERMADLQQVTPLGQIVSYNNASLSLAGRVIEKVTGKPYEKAMRELVLDPAGLANTFFSPSDVMTRRFAVGHHRAPDGTVRVLRPWAMPRSCAPMGGMSAGADQLAWARFHLDGGRAADGTQVLARAFVERMREPTAEVIGSAIGDRIGTSWLLHDVDGVPVIGHGGATLGQHSMFETVPSRGFALVALTNCEPNGPEFNEKLLRWAFEAYVGLVIRDPEPESRTSEGLEDYLGQYQTVAEVFDVTAADGGLVVRSTPKPELIAQLGEDADTEDEPFPIGLLAGEGDRYIVPAGPRKGMKGFFTREAEGRVSGLHVGGRLAPRVPE